MVPQMFLFFALNLKKKLLYVFFLKFLCVWGGNEILNFWGVLACENIL